MLETIHRPLCTCKLILKPVSKGSNNKHAGVITHYIESNKFSEVEEALCALEAGTTTEEISNYLKQFESEIDSFSLDPQLANIEQHFANKDSIHQIINELEG